MGKELQNGGFVLERRSMPDIPTKVFIERVNGGGYEYSNDAPALLNHQRIERLLYGEYACQNFIELFYSLPEIFAPVHEIAKRVSSAEWQLRKISSDQKVTNDPDFNRLFTQPNPFTTFTDFVYQAVCYEILTGKQFFFFNKPSSLVMEGLKSVISWSNLPSQKTIVNMKQGVDPYTVTNLSDCILNYQTPMPGGGPRIFETAQILPILHLSLENNYNLNHCKPFLMGAERAIRNLIPVYEARGIIFIKRGALGFLVSRKSDDSGLVSLTPGEKKEAQEEFQNTYGLTGGRNTVGVTAAPVDFVKTSMSIDELKPFEETMADAMAIYAVLRVPRHLVPNKDGSTFANASSDMKSFYSNVIIPWAKRYAEIWNAYLKLSDQNKYIYPCFDDVDELQENRKDKAEYENKEGSTCLQRWQNGIITLNDWIAEIDGTPVLDNPLYTLKVFEMTTEQLDQLKAVVNMKATTQPNQNIPNEQATI